MSRGAKRRQRSAPDNTSARQQGTTARRERLQRLNGNRTTATARKHRRLNIGVDQTSAQRRRSTTSQRRTTRQRQISRQRLATRRLLITLWRLLTAGALQLDMRRNWTRCGRVVIAASRRLQLCFDCGRTATGCSTIEDAWKRKQTADSAGPVPDSC